MNRNQYQRNYVGGNNNYFRQNMGRENFHYRDNRNDSLFDTRNARFHDNRDNSASPINHREQRIAAVDGTNYEMYHEHDRTMYPNDNAPPCEEMIRAIQ